MTDHERIRSALAHISPYDRDEWVKMGMAVKGELGEEGFSLWDEWSRQADNYNHAAARDSWKSFQAGAITVGTLFHLAKANGWKDDGAYQGPTPEQLAERRARALENAEKQRKKAERAAAKAISIWHASTPAGADHPYLVKKQVKPVATIREITLDRLVKLVGYHPQANGVPLEAGRVLVVPVKVGDHLTTCELIDGTGRKTALADGKKAGGYWAAQPLPDGDGQGLRLLLGEGVTTCLSAGEAAPGCPVVAALSCGNLLAVAQMLRERYPAADLIVLADLGNGQAKADETARAVGGWLAVPDFGPDRPEEATDFNDLATLRGPAAVAACIEAAIPPNGNAATSPSTPKEEAEQEQGQETAADQTMTAMVLRLAALPPLEYDLLRKDKAKNLGVRPATLDQAVKEARKGGSNSDLPFDEVDPWPEPVDPAALLTDIAAAIRRFIVCGQEVAHAVALWVAMTWFIDVVQVAPLAVITAPEKRCGKSQLLFLLGRLSARAITASSISPAALYRTIDAWQPTLLIDEADAFMKDNEELRGLINSGHTRDSAYVIRTVGESFTPTKFTTWGAKALAGIGHVADTLMDRAVILELRRKLPHERVDRIRYAEPHLFEDLRAKLARFAEDYSDQVRQARPFLPPSLNDRAQDNWEPLLAIALVAGGGWLEIGTTAALKLSGSESAAQTVGTELLADIKEVFEVKAVDRISTVELIKALCGDDEKPWATYNRGLPIKPRQLSKKLSGYGITSKPIRLSSIEVVKGYDQGQFRDAFLRYLAPPPSITVTRLQTNNDGLLPVTDGKTCNFAVTDEKTPEGPPPLACNRVTDRSPKPASTIIEVTI